MGVQFPLVFTEHCSPTFTFFYYYFIHWVLVWNNGLTVHGLTNARFDGVSSIVRCGSLSLSYTQNWTNLRFKWNIWMSLGSRRSCFKWQWQKCQWATLLFVHYTSTTLNPDCKMHSALNMLLAKNLQRCRCCIVAGDIIE